jgi:hypothetical protein
MYVVKRHSINRTHLDYPEAIALAGGVFKLMSPHFSSRLMLIVGSPFCSLATAIIGIMSEEILFA